MIYNLASVCASPGLAACFHNISFCLLDLKNLPTFITMHIAAVIGGLAALGAVTSAIQGPAPRAGTTYHDPTEPMAYQHPPGQQVPPIDTGSFLQRATRRPGSRPTSSPVLPYVPAAAAAVRVPGSLLPVPAYTRAGAGPVPTPSLPGGAVTPYAVDLGPGCQFRTTPPRLPASCRDRIRPIKRPTTTTAAVPGRADGRPEAADGRRYEAVFHDEVLRILHAMEKEHAEKERRGERRRRGGE